jgi:LysM repeat protein
MYRAFAIDCGNPAFGVCWWRTGVKITDGVANMFKNRLVLVGTLLLIAVMVSACYKDAGENVEPTSNRVNLSDLTPTAPEMSPATATPTVAPVEASPTPSTLEPTLTRTLVPTTTPFEAVEDVPTDVPAAATNTPAQIAPSFTPVDAGITTPGMSDILPSFTPAPTMDPSLQPTTTPVPPEENPCVHVVQPGDTLYSIATATEVELSALVAANPDLLGGSQVTPLQIGWQLQIPGCATTEEVEEVQEGSGETGEVEGEQPIDLTPVQGGTTHVVQPGETIFAIARQYGLTPEDIIAANNLANPDRINPGDTLIIPSSQ